MQGADPVAGPFGTAMSDGAARPMPRLAGMFVRFRSQLTNFTAFTILQAASYLIPVVTIPYFARTLGIAGMGLLALAGAVALAAGVLMDYAIQLSGTRFAASHADDHPAINRYFNATLLVKSAILLPILVALGIAALVLPQVGTHAAVFVWSLLSAAAICLFPQWLFQGLMLMPLAARILVCCRVGAAVVAMLLVRSPADVFIVPMTQAVAGGVALIAAAVTLRRRFGIVPGYPERGQCRTLFSENWTLFTATAWGATYTHGAIVIMGTMLSVTSIGFYSIAQKIAQAFVSMFNVAAQTGFPAFARAHDRAAATFGRDVRRYMAVVIAAAGIALIVMFAGRGAIYAFFAGRYDAIGVAVFSIWLASSLFTIVSVSLNPVMVVLRLDGQMARIYRYTGLTFLALAPIACAWFGVLGMTAATLLAEGFMALFSAVSVVRGLRGFDLANGRG